MTTTSCVSTDAQYAKALEVWRLLFEAEQLIIGDPDYSAAALHLSSTLAIVSTIQTRLESEQ